MKVKKYFSNIVEALLTTFEGMSITLDHFFRRPVTYDYYAYGDHKRMPKLLAKDGIERYSDTLSDGYRGILEVDGNICTGCSICEKACPIGVISIGKGKNEEKKMQVNSFIIDNSKCMYCGLCSKDCPTQAIQHTKEFEATNIRIENLVYDWAETPYVAYNVKKDGERERVELGSLVREKKLKFDVTPRYDFPKIVDAPKVKKKKLKTPPVVSGNRKTRIKKEEGE